MDPVAMEWIRGQRNRKDRWVLGACLMTAADADPNDPYVRNIEGLVNAVRTTSGAHTIVDSSGSASQASVLFQARSFQIEILHNIRDPRKAAYSLNKHTANRPAGNSRFYWMIRRGPARAALHRDWSNYSVERLARVVRAPYARIRYEDWVVDPAEVLSP